MKDEEKLMNAIGELRRRLDLKQAELGKLLGASVAMLRKYERGTKVPLGIVVTCEQLAKDAGLVDLAKEFSDRRGQKWTTFPPTKPVIVINNTGREPKKPGEIADIRAQLQGMDAKIGSIKQEVEALGRTVAAHQNYISRAITEREQRVQRHFQRKRKSLEGHAEGLERIRRNDQRVGRNPTGKTGGGAAS